jgi:Type IX secretion system protein PorV
MKKMYLVLATLFFVKIAIAGDQLTSAFEFLRTDFNPRTAAMGNAFSTARGDVGSLLINPAGMAYNEADQYMFNFTNYLLDINGGMLAYSQQVENVGVLSASIVYMDFGTIKNTTEIGTEIGTFAPANLALVAGWADHFDKGFSYGVNFKYVYSQIQDYNASAIALDFGLIWDVPFEDDLYLGLAVQNLGSNIEYYNKTQENLPFSVRLGVSKKLAHLPLEISVSNAELNNIVAISDVVKNLSVGGEFTISESVRLRIGYNNRLNSDLKTIEESNFGGLSGGLGIYVNKFRFDYSYSNFNLLGNTHRFGFSGTL